MISKAHVIRYGAGHTLAAVAAGKGLMTRREIEREVCLWGSNEHDLRFFMAALLAFNGNDAWPWFLAVALMSAYRLTAIICAVVICLLVSMGGLVNHYRDNAITYKGQAIPPIHKFGETGERDD